MRGYALRSLTGGALYTERDTLDWNPDALQVVTERVPSEHEWRDLHFAWRVVKHVKSNAIVVAKEGVVRGVGAGQMNRVGSVRLALEQAGEHARGASLASDAFFPFSDSIELAARAGVRAIVQPGGSKKGPRSRRRCKRTRRRDGVHGHSALSALGGCISGQRNSTRTPNSVSPLGNSGTLPAMRTTHDALRADGSPLLDTRAVPITDWTLAWDGNRIPVRVPSAWEDYGIPRAFEGPCDYLCAFTATPEAGTREWLHFGGASYEARGFVNDAPVGVHRGIWDSFCWDITDALRAGENRLRVQILKNGGATYPVHQVLSGFLPYVSCAFGGLWQAVHRFQTGAAWLCDLWARGEADGRVDITGALGGALPATVRLTLHDPDGRIVAEAHFDADAPQWTQAFQLAEPQPWSPAQPRLYRLVAEVWRDGRLSHRTETAFGLRTVAVHGATILLNGQPIYPRGILHWGWYLHTHAPNPDLQTAERELRAAQQCGFNMLKACLWVPSRAYLRLCDRLGLLVWLELPLWLPQMDAAQIAHATGEYAAIVRQVRNHPSIVLWTLGCELSARFPSDALGRVVCAGQAADGQPAGARQQRRGRMLRRRAAGVRRLRRLPPVRRRALCGGDLPRVSGDAPRARPVAARGVRRPRHDCATSPPCAEACPPSNSGGCRKTPP
jgi:hypothetical protein